MPELVDRLLLMLDAHSILSLAVVQPQALQILRSGSQPWRKLIKEALDDIQAVTCITFQDISQAQGTKPYSFIK